MFLSPGRISIDSKSDRNLVSHQPSTWRSLAAQCLFSSSPEWQGSVLIESMIPRNRDRRAVAHPDERAKGLRGSGSAAKGTGPWNTGAYLFTKIRIYAISTCVVPFVCDTLRMVLRALPAQVHRERSSEDRRGRTPAVRDETLRQYLEGYEKKRHGRDVSCIFLLGKRSLRDPRPPPEARGLPPLPLLLPRRGRALPTLSATIAGSSRP